ncbi:MAG: RagB/SusD family nutrient uptake outer membrane protein [Salinimicrobium sediminis]|uniref:Starch-binding associating with outer membrane n=1 Tax=Salinimicrobium sediminis TaxID=1343891 RepID=A0A285X221_9FLAO|nr:RagB/SusD family nutrient uptake outer membrane protein [Salinimicrobium sediminis]MDX1601745.1 RagB/SusD family nutrient uptake outer membrane protein [Salinimicrobium sediminis]MDX1752652.1 RagB/SusD family nutrient uptake outer membrane protein [Salinimicrobium sediminis]SOC78774.1 Starch-binding associating with outer membrane [Salinimicrobium sediminis]
MKISKNIFIRLSALAFALVLSSCSDKLDSQEGQLNTGDIDYTDASQMVEPLIGAYSEISSLGWEEPLLLGVRGDDVNAGGLGDQPLYAETDLFNYNKDFWMYNQVWNSHYNDVINMNTAILQIENFMEFANEADFERGQQYVAEIQVIRAWLHLNLARTWEDIFIITSNQPEAELEQGVATKEEVMQFISDQMDEAIPHLPDMRPNQRPDLTGGITRYTAYALKAMAQQELQNYQGVADATGAIISSGLFSLYPDFYQLFKKPGELSNESLWELQYSDYGTASGGEFYHNYDPFGPQNWTPARANASSGWGFYEPSMKFIGFMLDRNETVRLQTSVLFTPDGINAIRAEGYTVPGFVSNVTPSGDVINNYVRADFASGKHYLPSIQLTEGRNSYGGGKNFIIIRYAEILLMYAEALTRGASGTAMTATEAVNLVRERADMPALSGVTTQDVLDEKFAELAMEWGIRYYDMIRLDNYNELSYDGRTFTAADEYLPYPQAQVDALPLEATEVDRNTAMNNVLSTLNR